MTLTNIKDMPSNQKFGWLFTAIFLGGSAYFQWKEVSWLALSLCVLGVLFLLVTLFNPPILGPLNRAWFSLSLFLGKVVSPIVLSVVFFVVIVPVALMTRFFGRDALLIKKRNVVTYWVDKSPVEPDSFNNQF